MIRLLIVDDDPRKVTRIKGVVARALNKSDYHNRVAGNVASAWKILQEEQMDLVVVDLNIPLRNGAPPKKDGGVRLLRELTRRNRVKVPFHILGLTEYDDLRNLHGDEFLAESWHIIEFSWTSDAWEERLSRKVLHIAEGFARQPSYRYETDLGIITALHKIELEAVLALDGGWQTEQSIDDSTVYHRGTFKRGRISMNVVAAAAPEMGMAASAALTSKLIFRWRPRYLCMVGIAAGVKGKFGDILIADRAWDYGSGKLRSQNGGRRTKFLPAPSQVVVEQVMKAKLSLFLMKSDNLRGIRAAWRGRAVPNELSARIGPFASGAAVVSARGVINGLVNQHRKLLGVDMEAYGCLLAAEIASAPRPLALAIKSICDFGDKRKGDAYQKYAAFTSARFLYDFAFDQLISGAGLM